jgi:adenylosuccinate lyase
VIDRYSRLEMRKIWSDERKFQIWLEIEVLACEAMAELGQIPNKDAAEIRKRARFSIPEIAEIEKRTNHDVIAFLENVAGSVGPAARRFKMTPMIGRSHGVHAEPITFGLKLALMFDEFGRAEERLTQTRERIRVGKMSGAVGTHAHVDPKIERAVCEKLGLKPATLSTQIVQRDRHAEFMTTLAVIGSSIDRWATEFRHLQRTEVLEVEEFFSEGQKGSSAMPHKRNPITSERLSGLARVIRGNAMVALENVALWHERDISHSSAERIILPDSCILLDYMLVKLREIIEQLQVYSERMAQNLALTKGLYFSQSILLALTRAGAERKTAYEAVQRAAMKTWKGEGTFAENVKREPDIASRLSGTEIDQLCSLGVHFQHVDATFRALGLD